MANNQLDHLYSHFKYGDANYDKKEDCDWLIVTTADKKIYLKFVTFELEHYDNCAYDYVEIFDGYDDSSRSLGRFCGNKVSDNQKSKLSIDQVLRCQMTLSQVVSHC